MKLWKRMLCVFMAVVMLFFGVNNSYFSKHKMDEVHATSIVVGGTVVITVDMIVKLVCTLAIAGLSIGLINEWMDMDLNDLLENVHDWLAENVDKIDGWGIDGSSALKEWAVADTWTVIEGGGGTEPSPEPDDDEIEGGMGVLSPYTLISIGELAVGGVAVAEQLYNKAVSVDGGMLEMAKDYYTDKVSNYSNVSDTAVDPVAKALKYRYDGTAVGFSGYDGTSIPQYEDGTYTYKVSLSTTSASSNMYDVKKGGYLYSVTVGEAEHIRVNLPVAMTFYYHDGTAVTGHNQTFVWYRITENGSTRINNINCNFPIFENEEVYEQWLLGADVHPINKPRNYISTDDEYGWASSAGFTLADLLALFPEVALALNGKSMSLAGLQTAINALKAKLEENNPNPAGVADPVTYPSTDDYTDTIKDVIDDEVVFPDVEPAPNPEPEPVPTVAPSPKPSVSPKPSASPDDDNDDTKWVVDLSKFFPFCIPFDLIHLIQVLDAEPVAPRWEFPLELPAYGISYTFVIDMAQFETVAEVFRLCETILFVLSLILITRKLIRG